jgi:hypothetical protein
VICQAGGIAHEHSTVQATRECWSNGGPRGHAAEAIRHNAEMHGTGVHATMEEFYQGSESRGADRHEEQWDDRTPVQQQDPLGEGKPTETGVYHRNDKWYLVVEDRKSGYGWGYERGAITKIRQKDKADPEEIGAWGLLNHHCIKCFRPLSRGESMRRGYGPDCAQNHGWPYDHSSTD